MKTKDARVFLMGEDVGRYGGSYACSKGLLSEFGEERIRDTPLSQSGFVGAGIGAALGGGFDVLRPQLHWGPVRQDDATRKRWLEQYAERLRAIEKEQPIEVGPY